ncbi:DNA-directed RNA polymerase subunit D [Candidatus Pacearchaeota archaeon]|nr:DNA-directed RNA polymerase subunit D [Candidatus Pacearchaeota archaeon]
MHLIEKKENQITFKSDISDSLANAIRRYIANIPTLAIEEVEIIKNNSASYDETVAHRLGLVPLKMEKGEKPPKVKINVTREGMVYSDDMKGAEVVYKKIPITFLNKEQELELVAETKIGNGLEHSKFLPGVIFYRNIAEITVDKEIGERIKRMFPENETREKSGKITIIDDKKKEILDFCESICQKEGKEIEVETKDELVITLESFGQIPVKEIFTKSISELNKDLEEVAKKISKE